MEINSFLNGVYMDIWIIIKLIIITVLGLYGLKWVLWAIKETIKDLFKFIVFCIVTPFKFLIAFLS